jgi:hypothetical protein
MPWGRNSLVRIELEVNWCRDRRVRLGFFALEKIVKVSARNLRLQSRECMKNASRYFVLIIWWAVWARDGERSSVQNDVPSHS